MNDFLESFKGFNQTSKQIIIFIIVMCAFWTVPFCLFKPEFFNYPFYAQFAIIFSLAIIWYILTMFTSLKYIEMFDDVDMSMILLTLISIVLLCIAILVSYYYSNSFTFFLRVAFLWIMLPHFILQILIFVFVESRKKNSIKP